MTSILDIDLDYFRFSDDPVDRINELLDWADRPVDKVVDHHHKSFAIARWLNQVGWGRTLDEVSMSP
jgi:hypothetical protein